MPFNDGGPVFPNEKGDYRFESGLSAYELRDSAGISFVDLAAIQIAAQSMRAGISSPAMKGASVDELTKAVASVAYDMAEALAAEKNKRWEARRRAALDKRQKAEREGTDE